MGYAAIFTQNKSIIYVLLNSFMQDNDTNLKAHEEVEVEPWLSTF